MKNLLIATTALVATATVAAADISITGLGRFGVKTTKTDAVAAVVAKKLTTAQSHAAGTLNADGTYKIGAQTDMVAGTVDVADADKKTALLAVVAAEKALAAALAATDGSDAKTIALGNAQVALADAIANAAAIAGSDAVAAATNTALTSRIQLDVKGTFEASNGIVYSASARYRSTDGAANVGFNAPTFAAKSGALTIVVGNNYGQMYTGGVSSYNVGLTGLGFLADAFTGFDEYSSNGTGPQGVDISYSADGIKAGASYSDETKNSQFAVSYSAGGLTLAGAMQNGDTAAEDFSVVALDYAMGEHSFGVKYGDNNGTKTTVVGGTFAVAMGTSVTAFVKDENTAGVDNVYGLGFSHDLGGASLQGGFVNNAAGSVADLGVVFKF